MTLPTKELRFRAVAACRAWQKAHAGSRDASLATPVMFLRGDEVLTEPSPEHLARAEEVAELLSGMIRATRGGD